MRFQLKLFSTTLAYVMLMSAAFSVKADSVSDWGQWDRDFEPQVTGISEPVDVSEFVAGDETASAEPGFDTTAMVDMTGHDGWRICDGSFSYSCVTEEGYQLIVDPIDEEPVTAEVTMP